MIIKEEKIENGIIIIVQLPVIRCIFSEITFFHILEHNNATRGKEESHKQQVINSTRTVINNEINNTWKALF